MSEIAPTLPGELIQEAQAGSQPAAQALFDRYRLPLLAVIRAILSKRLRTLYDSDDFLQDTFSQIFTAHFAHDVLESPNRLWPYLRRIAENKVRDANRKYLVSQRHNITLELSLEQLGQVSAESRDLSPEEAFMLKDVVEVHLAELLEQLPTMLRQVVELLLQGMNGQEIARGLGVEPKRVYRAMAWLNRKVQDICS
jgi:RNA polymerase sigma factor (sigma-70 family)